MLSDQTTERAPVLALRIAVAVPVLYFGDQIVAGFFFPGYNFLSQSASQLGSDLARYPAIFNVGAILTGLATLVAAWGYLRAFQLVGANRILSWLTAIALVAASFMHLWAGVFAMPNPRHGANPFQVASLLLPILIALALWKLCGPLLKAYFLASIVLLVALMSNIVSIDRQIHDGLFQRLLALAAFPPIGVGAYVLLAQFRGRGPSRVPGPGVRREAISDV